MAKEKLHLGEDETKELLSPDKLLFAQKEENELSKIASLPAEQREKALVRHQKKYFWLNSDWANVIVLSVDYFRKRLNDAREQKTEKKLKDSECLSKRAKSLFYFFRHMTYNAISFAAPAEIIASKLKFTLAFKKHLESRTEKCAYYWDKQGHDAIVLIEKDYDAFIKALGIAFSSQFKELRGVSVSRGKIVGTVKIINIPAVRNRRVEAFFNADYGARFMYAEIAGRANFNQDWIMEVSVPEMFGALEGKPLPNETEMKRRFVNYAMLVRNSETTLITDPDEIKKLEREYFVDVAKAEEIRGKMACLGGIIRGKAKICLDKSEISKVERGDILVAQFTTPDFVQAMEKAAAVVADQGGLSSHAAIVSRELGVPCVIATMNGTRIIHDNDLLEIDAQKGVVKIVERA